MKSSTQKTLIIGLLSIPLSAGVALVPVLSNIGAAFPGREGWLQLLITLPALFMMFSSLFTNRLVKKISVKALTVISLAIILFAGISPYWLHSFNYLLFSRGLMGIGLGFLSTLIASLPPLYFDQEKQRDQATGIQAAFASAGGILFNLLSGFLAAYNWKYVFLVQLITLVPLMAAALFMPHVNPKADKGNEPYGLKGLQVKSALPVIGLAFFCILLSCSYPLNLSLFVEKNHLGSSQFVSLLTSLNAAIGFFIGLVFAGVYARLKSKTLPLAMGLVALTLFAISLAPTKGLLLLSSVLFGIGTSFVSPSLYAWLYQRVKAEEVVWAVALLGIASNVSQFVSPFVINPLAKLVDGHSLEKTRLMVAAILMVFLLVILVVQNKKSSQKLL